MNLLALAEASASFARAFSAPMTREHGAALGALLPADLRDLSRELRLDAGASLRGLEDAARGAGDPSELLLAYSSLFLAPPVPVPLNLGRYLDGEVMGESAAWIADCYRRHGVAPSEHFKDTPDHLVMALEFLTLLLAQAAEAWAGGDAAGAKARLADARAFAEAVLVPVLPVIAKSARAAAGDLAVSPFYAHLADLLCIFLAGMHPVAAHSPVASAGSG